MQTNQIPDPQTLADQTILELENSLKNNRGLEVDVLAELEKHYTNLQKNQELYIKYNEELIQRLKSTPPQDEEELEQLKKQVLQDVLSKEKTK